MVWPWPFARPVEPDPGPWARDTARTVALVDTSTPPQIQEGVSFRRDAPPKISLAAPVDLTGVPAVYSIRSMRARSRLQFPDGTELQSAQQGTLGVRSVSARRPVSGSPRNAWDRRSALQAVLGDVRLSGPGLEGDYQAWPILLSLREADYQRYRAMAGRLKTTSDFHLQRSSLAGSLPLKRGAVLWTERERFEIVDVLRRTSGCTIFMRRTSIEPLLVSATVQAHDYVLRNTARREALAANAHSVRTGHGLGPLGFGFFGNVSYGIEGSGRGFVVNHFVLSYPTGGLQPPDAPMIDGAWLGAADLAVIETSYAGRVTRSVTVDGFRMQRTATAAAK